MYIHNSEYIPLKCFLFIISYICIHNQNMNSKLLISFNLALIPFFLQHNTMQTIITIMITTITAAIPPIITAIVTVLLSLLLVPIMCNASPLHCIMKCVYTRTYIYLCIYYSYVGNTIPSTVVWEIFIRDNLVVKFICCVIRISIGKLYPWKYFILRFRLHWIISILVIIQGLVTYFRGFVPIYYVISYYARIFLYFLSIMLGCSRIMSV